MKTTIGSEEEVLTLLEQHGVLVRKGDRHRTTRRWQAAMARAASRLWRHASGERDDLRVSIALALLDFYGEDASDEMLAGLVEILLPIEAAELDPTPHLIVASSPTQTER